jgi:hypothetical protein
MGGVDSADENAGAKSRCKKHQNRGREEVRGEQVKRRNGLVLFSFLLNVTDF